MCGIFGYIGKKKLSNYTINKIYSLMYNRGPDYQNHFYCNKNNSHIYLFSSRLSIIDIYNHSNQPFFYKNYVIIFNGEIYNYIELRKKLKKIGIKLKTNSDVEVLLIYFSLYKEDCLKFFEGMWSFIIFDTKEKKFFISRDRFGEKPLYFYKDNYKNYFASELSYITNTYDRKLDINYNRIFASLQYGYKTLHKNNETYFKKIYHFTKGTYFYGKIDEFNPSKVVKYWNINNYKENSNSIKSEIINTREKIINSIDFSSRCDCDFTVSLSGGIDSSIIASVLKKVFNKNFKTYSIIDSDYRYNELDSITANIRNLKIDNELIKIKKEKNFDILESLIQYKNSPLSTTTILLYHSLLEKIKKDKIKVLLEGTAADEVYGGYIEHLILHLATTKNNKKLYQENINNLKKYHLNYIRNPLLKNFKEYSNNYENLNVIYNSYNINFLKKNNKVNLKNYLNSDFFSKNLLKNKMYNEIFYETTPFILNQNDSVSGFNSIENRSPFLNSEVVNNGFGLSSNIMIKNGYNKYILREAFKNILPKKIYMSREKKGFNGNIKSIFDFNSPGIKGKILFKKSPVYDIVEYNYVKSLLEKKFLTNSESKNLFSVINIKFFLEKNL